MQPGPELDHAIAQCLLHDGQYGCLCGPAPDGYDPQTGFCTRCGQRVPPRFSRDPDVAIKAADAIGIWDEGYFLKGNEIWTWGECCQSQAGCPGSLEPVIIGDDSAHALALAILRVTMRRRQTHNGAIPSKGDTVTSGR